MKQLQAELGILAYAPALAEVTSCHRRFVSVHIRSRGKQANSSFSVMQVELCVTYVTDADSWLTCNHLFIVQYLQGLLNVFSLWTEGLGNLRCETADGRWTTWMLLREVSMWNFHCNGKWYYISVTQQCRTRRRTTVRGPRQGPANSVVKFRVQLAGPDSRWENERRYPGWPRRIPTLYSAEEDREQCEESHRGYSQPKTSSISSHAQGGKMRACTQ